MKKLIILLLAFLCTGCNSYKEMNDLGIVGTVGIEKKDGNFLATAQVVNVSAFNTENASNSSAVYLIDGKGKTLFEAIRELQQKSAKILFLSHTKSIVLDKTILEDKEALKSVIDLLMRDAELSLNFNVVAATEVSVKDILATLSPVESLSAVGLEKTIKFSVERYGIGYKLIAKDFYNNYFSYGINNVYSNINVQNNNEDKSTTETLQKSDAETFTYIDGAVSFNKKGEMIRLNNKQNFTLNLLQNNFSLVPYVVPCGDKTFTIETHELKFGFSNFNNDMIDVNGDVVTFIAEYNCDYDISKTKTLVKLKELISDSLEKDIKDLIKFAKESENDFIGIGKYIYKNHPNYFDFENKNWDTEGLSKINVQNVKIDVKLLKEGNLKGDIRNEK